MILGWFFYRSIGTHIYIALITFNNDPNSPNIPNNRFIQVGLSLLELNHSEDNGPR